ncbi:uncharacterized protein YifN (PemK superfamily) [Kineosporia succinea]|uniref:Uncharacterized protein YifN (PemK superfamily) n=1 Tax=Kineosporia succinea TaxID=84632 RepID=A0ABT9P8N6_9ACTN|nr:PRC-barrel domain-containing protein [Kineosporia succinea]MDP9828827.1 uncharacterized protein YifN (PemK superfamily) [Kineosporia succinea]
MSTNSWDPWNYRTDAGVGTGRDLAGLSVQATDGHIGKVDEATYETDGSYIVVDTGPWIFGKKVLLPAAVIRSVDVEKKDIHVDLTKDQIKDSPKFEQGGTWSDTTHRDDVGTYYGRGFM